MRLRRLRRRLFALPGHVARHGHTLEITLLDVGAAPRRDFQAIFLAIRRR